MLSYDDLEKIENSDAFEQLHNIESSISVNGLQPITYDQYNRIINNIKKLDDKLKVLQILAPYITDYQQHISDIKNTIPGWDQNRVLDILNNANKKLPYPQTPYPQTPYPQTPYPQQPPYLQTPYPQQPLYPQQLPSPLYTSQEEIQPLLYEINTLVPQLTQQQLQTVILNISKNSTLQNVSMILNELRINKNMSGNGNNLVNVLTSLLK